MDKSGQATESGKSNAAPSLDALEQDANTVRTKLEELNTEKYPKEGKEVLQSLWVLLDKYRSYSKKCSSDSEGVSKRLDVTSQGLLDAKKELGEKSQTISTLTKTLEDKEKELDASHLREQDCQETLGHLRDRITGLEVKNEDLKSKLEHAERTMGRGSFESHDDSKAWLAVAEVQEKLSGCQEQLRKKAQEIVEVNFAMEIKDKEKKEVLKTNTRNLKMKSLVEKQVQEMKKAFIKKQSKMKKIKIAYTKELRQGACKQKMLEELEETAGKFIQNFLTLEDTSKKLVDRVWYTENKIEGMEDEREYVSRKIMHLLSLLNSMNQLALDASNKYLNCLKKLQISLTNKNNVIKYLKDVESSKERCQKDVQLRNKEIEALKKVIQKMKRDKRMGLQRVLKLTEELRESKELTDVQIQNGKVLKNQNEHLAKYVLKLASIGDQRQEEAIRFKDANSKLHETIEQALNLRMKREVQIAQYQEEIIKLEGKLAETMEKFDNVKAEKNNETQDLQVTKDQHDVMKHKMMLIGAQVEQLKEEVVRGKTQLTQANLSLKKKRAELDSLGVDLKRARKGLHEERKNIEKLTSEKEALKMTIAEKEKEKDRKDALIAKVHIESEMMASRVDKKVAELRLVRQKMDVMESEIKVDKIQYNQRLEDIRVLKIDLNAVRQEKSVLEKAFQNMYDYRKEIYRLNRELANERLKNRLLEEESMKPINVHRWRLLEHTDPKRMELIEKIRLLEKRLALMNEELANKSDECESLKGLYATMREALERLPGPEVAEHVQDLKRKLNSREDQLKAVVAELSVAEEDAKLKRIELKQSKKELSEVKKNFYEMKHLVEKRKQTVGAKRKTSKKHFESQQILVPDPTRLNSVLVGMKEVTTNVCVLSF